jgi:hypothetical protein
MKKLNPWRKIGEKDDSEQASIIRAILDLGDLSYKLDPWLPFPQNLCAFKFGKDKLPIPIGALLILWKKCPLFIGRCPKCKGVVYGYGFGGFLSFGGISGCCLNCGIHLHRQVGGLSVVSRTIRPFLEETPYFLDKFAIFGGSLEGSREPLLTVLRKMGVKNIPSKEWALQREESLCAFTTELTERKINEGGKRNKGEEKKPSRKI